MSQQSRRDFLRHSAGAALALKLGATDPFASSASAARIAAPHPSPATLSLKKGLVLSMLPSKLSITDRFKLARDAGFEVIQAPTTPDRYAAEEILRAADSASVRVDSVMNMAHWEFPLSSPDATVVEKSMD